MTKLSTLNGGTPETTFSLSDFLVKVKSGGAGDVLVSLQNFLNAASPQSTAWVPTPTGFSALPTGALYQYVQVGKLVTLFIAMPSAGTSNATTFTIPLPFTARTLASMTWIGEGVVVDSGTTQSTPGLLTVASGGTVLNVFKTFASGAFTASGSKALTYGTITYEIA